MKKKELFAHRLYEFYLKNDGIERKFDDSIPFEENIKKFCYEKYVIKPDEIPASYFKGIEERYFTEGYGKLYLANTASKKYDEKNRSLRYQLVRSIIREQEDSLGVWLDFLLGDESNSMPICAKLCAFQSVITFNDFKNGKVEWRNSDSTNPFMRFDKEVLNKCINYFKEQYNFKSNKMDISKLLNSDVYNGLFQLIYLKEFKGKESKLLENTNGIWKEYEYGNDIIDEEIGEITSKTGKNEYDRLHNDIKGYNTSWRIEGICAIKGGFFQRGIIDSRGRSCHVYYTEDENYEYKIPRLFVTVDHRGSSVYEARGIKGYGEIEDSLLETAEEYIKRFYYGRNYLSTVRRMKKLEEINKIYKERELTYDEINFIRYPIKNFDEEQDLRQTKINRTRDRRKDYAILYKCSEEEIGLEVEDLYKHQLVYYDKSLIYDNMFRYMRRLGFNLPKYVNFGVILPRVKCAEGIVLPEYASTMALPRLETAEGLHFSDTCYYSFLDLWGLTDPEGLVLPKRVGYIDISNLSSLVGVTLPERSGHINYHNKEYTLEELREVQEYEELNNKLQDEKALVRGYGRFPTWYTKNG